MEGADEAVAYYVFMAKGYYDLRPDYKFQVIYQNSVQEAIAGFISESYYKEIPQHLLGISCK